jgi:hypothetical protein
MWDNREGGCDLDPFVAGCLSIHFYSCGLVEGKLATRNEHPNRDRYASVSRRYGRSARHELVCGWLCEDIRMKTHDVSI